MAYTVHTLQNPKGGEGTHPTESLSVYVEWPASLYCSRRQGFLFKGIKGCFADMAIFFNIFNWRRVLIGLDWYYAFIVY